MLIMSSENDIQLNDNFFIESKFRILKISFLITKFNTLIIAHRTFFSC